MPLDLSSWASDPGNVRLSLRKLKRLCPEMYGLGGLIWTAYFMAVHQDIPSWNIATILKNGDSRAAVVVRTSPLLVAAYTDELDCVSVLKFDDSLTDEYGLSVGSRLLTINIYTPRTLGLFVRKDLLPGPYDSKQFGNFQPFIADFLSDDDDRIMERKSNISEEEWMRALELGQQYLEVRPGMARDGKPSRSEKPAKKRY